MDWDENRRTEPAQRRVDSAGAISMSPDSRSFEFHYTALSLLVSRRVRFRYFLEGLDREWVDADARRAATCIGCVSTARESVRRASHAWSVERGRERIEGVRAFRATPSVRHDGSVPALLPSCFPERSPEGLAPSRVLPFCVRTQLLGH